ncbi:MAG: DUF1704 domain-containing protein [Candidatus Moranbacteria bacterium]|nr:DUF1704 domain-containing protein [Candidatus Moranbacteria bacterium]
MEHLSAHRQKPENIPGAFDDLWYKSFKSVGAFQDYEYLTSKKDFREDQKNKFLSGEIENPTLDYPELENFDFDQREQRLLLLKKDILAQEQNDTLGQLYCWRINEKLAELRMLRAAYSGDDKRFVRYSKFVYGKPDKKIYEYSVSQVKQVIDEKLFNSDPEISAAAKRLNTELFEVLINNDSKINPLEYNLPTPKKVENEKEYQAEEIKIAFEEYLRNQQIAGWQVIVDREGKYRAINVSQESKTVNVPETRKLKHSDLLALIEHELGTHVLRRERGERSKLKLLGLGLDRYLKGEEGLATYKEQQVKGAKGFRGLDYHFAISLALGIDGKKRDFRKVFEILRDYHFINSKKEKDLALKFAQDEAWSDCLRIFRGTTCKTPGACLTRDIVYREGNIGIWDVVKNNPEEARRFSIGKYDPTNPRHIWILEQLGITDEDLDNLET